MPNLFQRALGIGAVNDAAIVEAHTATLLSQRNAEYDALALDHERAITQMDESVRELSLFWEDIGWDRLDGWSDDSQGFSLKTIKEQADRCRSLLAVNPIIKKASGARIGYVWGKGVTFDNAPRRVVADVNNEKKFFTDASHEEMERVLQTEGNIFALRSKNTAEVIRVPLEQITGWSVNENDTSRVEYWLREYTVYVTDYVTGQRSPKTYSTWYPAQGQGGSVGKIGETKVDRTWEMVHAAVNRQDGWILGLPDLIAGMFWARAHKELFEAGTTFVKAQGRYASKVVAKTGAGAQKSAAAVAAAPRRDETTGEILEYGGTAVMSGGLDMQLMGKMSGGVDFNVFKPVLAMIAAGLEVPVSVLAAESDSEERSLEASVVDGARSRQNVWSEFFKSIFGRPNKFEAKWPQIKVDSTYRQIQSIEIANKTNALTRVELRKLSLDAFGIEADENTLPTIEDNPAYAVAAALAELQAKIAQDAADQQAKIAQDAADKAAADPSVPEQGVDAGIGKLSNGADAKDARDKGEIASSK